jgi:AraC-like DNA-binding protein/mannose-6-phosphate isomerase-like protein (cupin superfamily)
MLNVERREGPVASAIPEVHTSATGPADSHMVFWCLAGTATVAAGDLNTRITPGQCVQVPPSVPRRIDVCAGGIVVPVKTPAAGLADPGEPQVHNLGTGWNTWILHHFAAWISPMRTVDYSGDQLIAEIDDRTNAPALPCSPVEPGARAVASTLIRNPGDTRDVGRLADTAGVSVRTLQRTFLRETGVPLEEWRRVHRLAASREYLLAGYPVEWTAHQVGFSTVQGFIHSFGRRYGISPAAWARQAVAAGGVDLTGGERVGELRRNDRLIGAFEASESGEAPPIPATLASRRTYDDVSNILWMYRGTARVTIDDEDFHLSQGDAIWMPLRHAHEVEVSEGSVALPITFRENEMEVGLDDVVVARVPSALTNYMLHHVVANLTKLVPEGYDRLEVLGVFGEYLHRRREMTLSMPTTPTAVHIARTVLDDLRDSQSTDEWGRRVDVSGSTVNRWFRQETGRGFVRWRTLARIQQATELLDRGLPPVSVARRVGYRHLSGFSRDFRNHLGMTPREYAGQR